MDPISSISSILANQNSVFLVKFKSRSNMSLKLIWNTLSHHEPDTFHRLEKRANISCSQKASNGYSCVEMGSLKLLLVQATTCLHLIHKQLFADIFLQVIKAISKAQVSHDRWHGFSTWTEGCNNYSHPPLLFAFFVDLSPCLHCWQGEQLVPITPRR